MKIFDETLGLGLVVFFLGAFGFVAYTFGSWVLR